MTIDGRDYDDLAELANERGVTLATVVREALGVYVKLRWRG